MSRVFCYCRVSTAEQNVENQILEITNAGFSIEPHRIITETLSGSVPAGQRPKFSELLIKLEKGDVLVITKLDRLGRNASDIRSTIDMLTKKEVRVNCLQLGGVDLTSSSGKLQFQVIAALAEFERDLIVERTQAGLKRVKESGKKLGRKTALNSVQKGEVIELLNSGVSVSEVARRFDTSRTTIIRERKKSETNYVS